MSFQFSNYPFYAEQDGDNLVNSLFDDRPVYVVNRPNSRGNAFSNRGSNFYRGGAPYYFRPSRAVPTYRSTPQRFVYPSSEQEGEGEEESEGNLYTLDDILNLVTKHTRSNPERYDAIFPDLLQTTRVPNTEDRSAAAALAAIDEAQKQQETKEEEEDQEMTEEEKEKPSGYRQELDGFLSDLIARALTGGDHQGKQSQKANCEENGDNAPATPIISASPKKVNARRKSSTASFKKPAKVSSFHLSAPSPVHDPLQVSQPQLDSNLPFSPNVDVYDKPDLYKVVLSLPGANKKSFEIDFHPSNHELFIKGVTNNKDKLVNDHDLQYLKVSEIKFGSFERTIKFPILPKVKDEEIKAKYCNGLLEITIPKLSIKEEDVKPKKRVTVEEVEDEELKFEDGLKKLI